MTGKYIVHGEKGSGSVAVEATLQLLGVLYEVIERAPGKGRPAGNPMGQVPVLILPGGEMMTESAAILIHLADTHPASGLSPAIDDPRRPAFLRWMMFVSSQIYALMWVRDDPRRLAANTDHESIIMERTLERIALCWRMMDAAINPGRYILGDDLTVLDIYVAMVSHWGPRRDRFTQEAPKMAAVIRRVDSDSRLADIWRRRLG